MIQRTPSKYSGVSNKQARSLKKNLVIFQTTRLFYYMKTSREDTAIQYLARLQEPARLIGRREYSAKLNAALSNLRQL